MASDIEASMAALRQLKEQSNAKLKEHQELQRRIQEIEQEKDRIDKAFEEELVCHAQADCRQFASMMYAKLPQEIRDMVYAYLYLEDAPIPIGSHHFTTYVEPADDDSQVHRAFNDANTPFIIPEGAVTHDHSIAPPSGVVLPTDRTLNPVYLGHQVAFEASKFYYSSNIFSICTLFNTLSTFLFTDPARGFARSPESKVQPLGLLPIDYVRSLQIRIKYEHFRTYAIKPEPSTGRRPEKTVYRGIFSNLGPLREWGERTASPDRRAEFIIMTAFRTRHDALNLRTRLNVLSLELQNRRFTNLLEAMRPSIYTLKHDAGANISVLHHDETWTPFPRNISAIFSLTKTQWEYEKSILRKEEVTYSPFHYWIAPRSDGTPEEGFACAAITAFLKGRWGLSSALDTQCTYPIEEGAYWPKGRVASPESKRRMTP